MAKTKEGRISEKKVIKFYSSIKEKLNKDEIAELLDVLIGIDAGNLQVGTLERILGK